MNAKKVFALLFALMMALALAGCGGTAPSSGAAPSSVPAQSGGEAAPPVSSVAEVSSAVSESSAPDVNTVKGFTVEETGAAFVINRSAPYYDGIYFNDLGVPETGQTVFVPLASKEDALDMFGFAMVDIRELDDTGSETGGNILAPAYDAGMELVILRIKAPIVVGELQIMADGAILYIEMPAGSKPYPEGEWLEIVVPRAVENLEIGFYPGSSDADADPQVGPLDDFEYEYRDWA